MMGAIYATVKIVTFYEIIQGFLEWANLIFLVQGLALVFVGAYGVKCKLCSRGEKTHASRRLTHTQTTH